MQTAINFACFLSMIRPPGVQFEDALIQIAPVDKAKCPFVRDHVDVEFQLYTKYNPTVYQELIINDDERLFASNIDFHLPTVIYFHAFMETSRDGSAARVREAYIIRGDTNIIMVDASQLEAGPWYFTAAENTWYIGNFAAKFIDYLVSRGLDLKKTHLVGHSLGAQSAGVAGFAIKSGRVARITGLDPALPLFYGLPPEQRLDKSDADFVDVIHTDAGIFGFNQPVGHADFYPNGGISPQPGCELEVVIPQHLLLNKCDTNSHPKGFYTYHLTPNKRTPTKKLYNSLHKLFTKMHLLKTEERKQKPVEIIKKSEIFANKTQNVKEEEVDQVMVESVNNYDTIPYLHNKSNNYEEVGTMKPIYKNVENVANIYDKEPVVRYEETGTMKPINIGTHVENTDEKSNFTIKENIGENTEMIKETELHKNNSRTKSRVKRSTTGKNETVTANTNNESTEKINDKEKEESTTMKSQAKPTNFLRDHEYRQRFHALMHEHAEYLRTRKRPIKRKHTIHSRQKRFINPFKKSEEEQQENLLFRLLNFVFKLGRSIPVYSVMREINTLVKSAHGELNHASKERNNFIGAPPPLVPVSYSLELGNENKGIAFMKRLLGLAPNGDRLTISGTGK